MKHFRLEGSKSIILLEGSKASPACPNNMNNTKIKAKMVRMFTVVA